MTHAKNILAQLRQAERDPKTPDDLRDRLGDRADELETQIEEREVTE